MMALLREKLLLPPNAAHSRRSSECSTPDGASCGCWIGRNREIIRILSELSWVLRAGRRQLLKLLARVSVHNRFRRFSLLVRQKSVGGAQDDGSQASATTSELSAYVNRNAGNDHKNSYTNQQCQIVVHDLVLL
jgi:hypothetical protein